MNQINEMNDPNEVKYKKKTVEDENLVGNKVKDDPMTVKDSIDNVPTNHNTSSSQNFLNLAELGKSVNQKLTLSENITDADIDSMLKATNVTLTALSDLGTPTSSQYGEQQQEFTMLTKPTYPTILDLKFEKYQPSNFYNIEDQNLNTFFKPFMDDLESREGFDDYSEARVVINTKNTLYQVTHDPFNYDLPREEMRRIFSFIMSSKTQNENNFFTEYSEDQSIEALYMFRLAIKLAKSCDYLTSPDKPNEVKIIQDGQSLQYLDPKAFSNLPFMPSAVLNSGLSWKLAGEIVEQISDGPWTLERAYGPTIEKRENRRSVLSLIQAVTTGDSLSEWLQGYYYSVINSIDNPVEDIMRELQSMVQIPVAITRKHNFDYDFYRYRMASYEERLAMVFSLLFNQSIFTDLLHKLRNKLELVADYRSNLQFFSSIRKTLTLASDKFSQVYNTIGKNLIPVGGFYDFISLLAVQRFCHFDIPIISIKAVQTGSIVMMLDSIIEVMGLVFARIIFPQLGTVLFDNYLLFKLSRAFPDGEWGDVLSRTQFNPVMEFERRIIVTNPSKSQFWNFIIGRGTSTYTFNTEHHIHQVTSEKKTYTLPEPPNYYSETTVDGGLSTRLFNVCKCFGVLIKGFQQKSTTTHTFDKTIASHLLSMVNLLQSNSRQIAYYMSTLISPYMERIFSHPLSGPLTAEEAATWTPISVAVTNGQMLVPPRMVSVQDFHKVGWSMMMMQMRPSSESSIPSYATIQSDFFEAQEMFKKAAPITRFKTLVNLITSIGGSFKGISELMHRVKTPRSKSHMKAWFEYFKEEFAGIGEKFIEPEIMLPTRDLKSADFEYNLGLYKCNPYLPEKQNNALVQELRPMKDLLFEKIDKCCTYLINFEGMLFPKRKGIISTNSTTPNRYFDYHLNVEVDDLFTDISKYLITRESGVQHVTDDGMVIKLYGIPAVWDGDKYVQQRGADLVEITSETALLVIEKAQTFTVKVLTVLKALLGVNLGWSIYYQDLIGQVTRDVRMGQNYVEMRRDDLINNITLDYVKVPQKLNRPTLLSRMTIIPIQSRLGTISQGDTDYSSIVSTYGMAKVTDGTSLAAQDEYNIPLNLDYFIPKRVSGGKFFEEDGSIRNDDKFRLFRIINIMMVKYHNKLPDLEIRQTQTYSETLRN